MLGRNELVPATSPLHPQMPSKENMVPAAGSPQRLANPTGLQQQHQPNMLSNALMPATGSLQQPPMLSDKEMNPATGSLQQPNAASNAFMPGAGSRRQFMGDRNMLTLSDDTMMMKQIQATHAPDGREVDVRQLVFLVEDIFQRANINLDPVAATTDAKGVEYMEGKPHRHALPSMHDSQEKHAERMEEKFRQDQLAMLDSFTFIFDRISCEIKNKVFGGADAHATALSICNMLSYYHWDAKAVLTLAAFALDYGEFWLLAHIYTSNQLAKSMAMLRKLPTIMEHSAPLKPRFDALNNLIRAMLEVTKLVVGFRELPSSYISPQDMPPASAAMAHLPTAVYWIIRGVIACASQITGISTMGHEYITSTTEAWELSSLAHKLRNIYDHLNNQLDLCLRLIAEKRNIEAYQMLLKLFEIAHIDNMKVLKALLASKENDMQPIIDGQTKKRVSLEVLRRRNVLLLISDLKISQDELSMLEQIYNESRSHGGRLESAYEVVWIPIVDPSVRYTEDEMHNQFEILRSNMPWYSVHHPKQVEGHVIRFIKEVWHFRNKTILVVLDPQGRVACPNAIHMMWIWGSTAFPFTSAREEALWKEESWRLELLIDGFDPTILNWIRDEKYIFLYGGDNIEWIRNFTAKAKAVALAENIPLEMAYVGKSNKREKVRQVISTVTEENLSYTWGDLTMIWYFWARLESMLFSKIQLGKMDDHDNIMREIKKILSYDKEGGCAILCKGSRVIVSGHSTHALTTVLEHDIWKEHIKHKGFDNSYKDHHNKLHGDAPICCRFEFQSAAGHGRIPESMKCPECLRIMDKFITFLCCHEDSASDVLRHEGGTLL